MLCEDQRHSDKIEIKIASVTLRWLRIIKKQKQKWHAQKRRNYGTTIFERHAHKLLIQALSFQHIVPGSYTRTGDPIVTMLNDDDLEIEADIPTVRALNLVPNMSVQGKLQNEVLFKASSYSYSPGKYANTYFSGSLYPGCEFQDKTSR